MTPINFMRIVIHSAVRFFPYTTCCAKKRTGLCGGAVTSLSGIILKKNENHTQKLAIDLSDYYKKSSYATKEGLEIAIDAVPVLAETGEGAQMAFYDGVSAESTEELAGTWCGDLLQIVDELPEGFQLINCCFAEIWSKAKDYYQKNGTNENGLIITNTEGELYEAASLNYYFKRGPLLYIKVTLEEENNRIKYATVKVE